MSQDEVARRLSAVGAKVRRGKLGSVLAVDFSKNITTDVTDEVPPESFGPGAELPPWVQDLGECVKCRELVLAGQPLAIPKSNIFLHACPLCRWSIWIERGLRM